jgi:hypothetical protein
VSPAGPNSTRSSWPPTFTSCDLLAQACDLALVWEILL